MGLLCLQSLGIVMDLRWPGSLAHTVVRIATFCYFAMWIGLRVWRGYRRRRPHWTRESWLRYLRFAVMPTVVLAVVLLVSSIDMSSNTLGAPRSPTRAMVAFTMLAMMLLGVVGLIRVLGWIERGEPSEQFTRTRWFQRRSSGNI